MQTLSTTNNLIPFPQHEPTDEEIQEACFMFLAKELEAFFTLPNWRKDYIFALGAVRGVLSAKKDRESFNICNA